MKRDLELIRHILLTLEASDYSHRVYIENFVTDEYSLETISYHINLLLDCNYIDATPIPIVRCHYIQFNVHRITSQGHDYLDSIRDDTIWKQTKEKIGNITSSVSLDIVKTVAQKIILGLIGI